MLYETEKCKLYLSELIAQAFISYKWLLTSIYMRPFVRDHIEQLVRLPNAI